MSTHFSWSTISIHAEIGEASNLIQRFSSKIYRAQAASNLGIDGCIRNCQRQAGQSPSKTTLSSAFGAIVAAFWIDCKMDFAGLERVVHSIE